MAQWSCENMPKANSMIRGMPAQFDNNVHCDRLRPPGAPIQADVLLCIGGGMRFFLIGDSFMTAGISSDTETYARQGFGRVLGPRGRLGLLIVDLVNGFADPAYFGGGNIPAAIAGTSVVLDEARSRGWPIAFTRVVFAEDGSDANIFSDKVPSLLSMTESSALSHIVDALAPRAGEAVIRKTLPSAFFGTGLAPWFARQAIQTIVVCGAVTSGCVRATVVDAMCHGFRPIVLEDCVGDRSIGPHQANLFDMGQKNADVMPWAELRALLGASD